MQLIQQFLRDRLRLGVFHAVNYTVPDCADGSETDLLFESIDQKIRR